MIIIGCDFHPSWQQISWLDKDTGETAEQKLVHALGDAQKFYQQLAAPALIGMEATLLDAAHAKAVSGDRFDREQLAGAPGRPPRRIDRRVDWALSPRYGSGFG
jgi:hypothetical protein